MEHTKKPKPRWIIPAIAVAALLLAAGLGLFLWLNSRANMEITAAPADETHIGVEGVFTVTGAGNMNAEELRSRLRFEPFVEFRVERDTQADAFRLRTFRPLTAGERIFIALTDAEGAEKKRWEFQTEDAFRVVKTFPANGAAEVPPSHAVEVNLSYGDIDEETVDSLITLTPDIPFHSSMRGNLLIITPDDRFFPAGADIQVVVAGELARKNGDTLGEASMFSFTTGLEEDRDFQLSSRERVTENNIPGDDILLKLSLGERLQEQELTTTVYRYPDADGYRDALCSYRDTLVEEDYRDYRWRNAPDLWQVNTEGLAQVMQYTAPAVAINSNWSERYVLLPDALDPGWYAATVEAELPSGGKARASKLIQVGELSVYQAQSSKLEADGGNRMLTWVNNAATGKPVEGAVVSVAATGYAVTGRTAEDGVAAMDGTMTRIDREGTEYREDDRGYYSHAYGLLEIAADDERFLDIYGDANYMSFYEGEPSHRYISYLFTDRPLYRSTDTVRVWGLIRPRREGTALPAGLRLTMGDDTVSVPITPGTDGTFQAEIQLEAMSDEYPWVYLKDGEGMTYCDQWVRVEDFVKPVYQTAASTERPLYTAWGDPVVNVAFAAAYFEGTPAQDYRAVARKADEYRPGNFAEIPFATDADGKATVPIAPLEPEEDRYQYEKDKWRPQKVEYGIFSDEELNEPQVQGGTFYYLFRDIALVLEKEDNHTVTARAYHIDPSRIREEADLLVDENLLGAPADVELTAELHKIYNRKTPSGERYDPIAKQSVTAYEYERIDEVADTFTAKTSGGEYRFTGLPGGEKDAGYTLMVTAADTRGKPVLEELNYSPEGDLSGRRDFDYFQMLKREPENAERLPSIDIFAQGFVDGETLDIYLVNHEEEVADPGARMLYIVSQDDIVSFGTARGTTFQLPYDERYLPNYSLCGAYFDGRHVYATSWSGMQYVPEQRELDIAIRPEKESYDPGDSAGIAFRVTEKHTAKPATGATLVAAVVDEAVFAMEEQQPEFLKKLYRPVFSPNILQYTSYDNHETGGGGYGGGGDGPFAARTDFEDTASFVVLTTGQDGTATLDVPLPDNLTSWRVTALALSPDLKAGNTKNNFAVSKDFFVTPVLPARLLAGDELVVTAKAAGEATNPGDAVSYTCTVEGAPDMTGTAQAGTALGPAGDYTPLTMGSLPAGDYRITVTGERDGLRDAVTLPLSVVDSGIDITVTRRMPLVEAGSLRSTTYPVTLGFYDKKNELYMEIFNTLIRYSDGQRVDQRMAARFVMERMHNLGLEAEALDMSTLSDNFERFRPEYQMYRLFPYAQDDPVLTARIYATMPPEYVDGGPGPELGELPGIVDPAERSAGYLRYDPKSAEIKILREAIAEQLNSGVYSLRDKLYLALALHNNGGEKEAKEWFATLTGTKLIRKTDADGGELLSLPDEASTAAALLAATAMDLPEAEGLARQLATAEPVEDLCLLELVYYLDSLPGPSGAFDVLYLLDGEEQTLRVTDGVHYQSFSKAQLEGANLRSDGEVWVVAKYTAKPDEASDRDHNLLSVTKTVEAADGGALRQGSLAKITLRCEAPDSLSLDEWATLRLEDYVPTGMRYERLAEGNPWHLDSRNDQRIGFTVTNKDRKELVYYARCVAPGSYVCESAYGSAVGGTAWGMSERGIVEINR